MQTAFSGYGAGNVTVTVEGNFLVVKNTGIPDHKSPYFATTDARYEANTSASFKKAPNTISQQSLTFKIPTNPTSASTKSAAPLGPIGVSLNGIPFFNQYAAMGAALTNEIFGFDQYGGHPQQLLSYPRFYPDLDYRKKQLDTLHRLSAFEFRNQNNQKITRETFGGKVHVANFFFTICPRLMANMQEVQQAFRGNQNMLIASYSVTPEIDSVAALRRYANLHGIVDGKWHLMTGNKKAIYEVARKGYFADENLGVQKGENDFLHTENFILVDKNLHIRGIYNGTLPLEIKQLIEDIRTLQKE